MAEAFLSMTNVSKRYAGVRALDGVRFELFKGEIHCLMGENGSGKSTLIKIISGVVRPDEGGRIEIEGKAFSNLHSIDSIRRGVEVIYQDLSLFPNLTVAENIAFLQLVAEKDRLMRWRKARETAIHSMARIDVSLPLDAAVGDLCIADQQLVAICRALTSDVKLLIMDEPTTALTRKEVAALFAIMRELRSRGIAILFISHKLEESLAISDRLTVLRDGRIIGTYGRGELSTEKLTFLMTGKTVECSPYAPDLEEERPLLEVRNFCRKGDFSRISFSLNRGEILGITGLLGSGRTELALALFGVAPPDTGELFLQGERVSIRSVQDAMRHGIGYVPEDRMLQGLVIEQSVGKNIVITVIGTLLGRLGLIDPSKREATIAKWIEDLVIKIPSIDSPVQTLSGGNQQRVVLAKWIATSPKVLILDSPTVGIDVAAKSSIHGIIRGLAKQGMGIIIISDEIPEVMNNCSRIMVMHHGRIESECRPADASEREIQERLNGNEEAAALS